MLDATEFQTVAGPDQFVKGENMATPGMVGQWQKGEFELVWPKSRGHGQRRGAQARLGVNRAAAGPLRREARSSSTSSSAGSSRGASTRWSRWG